MLKFPRKVPRNQYSLGDDTDDVVYDRGIFKLHVEEDWSSRGNSRIINRSHKYDGAKPFMTLLRIKNSLK